MAMLAAIDIGSNAMRLAIASFSMAGEMNLVLSMRESVRLGADVFANGKISPTTMRRAVSALKRFRSAIDAHQVTAVRAVATSAMRDAKNANQLIKQIEGHTGIAVEVISGDEEGDLVYGAVDRSVRISRSSALLVDIGGGSVESCLLQRGQVLFSESVKLGTVRLLQIVARSKRPVELMQKLVRSYAKQVGARLHTKRGQLRLRQFIGTGGNIECFGALRKRVLRKKSADYINISDLEELVDRIAALTVRQRISKLKLRKDRADVILPAGILLLAIMREARIKQLAIPGVGLKEGVLYNLWERLHSKSPSKSRSKSCSKSLSKASSKESSKASTRSKLRRR